MNDLHAELAFGALAPVLVPGRPDPAAVSALHVRLVLDADAAAAR